MKKILLILIMLLCQNINSQTFSTNLTPVGWEHNILFNAGSRYTVTRTGPMVDIPTLFDGGMYPYYTATPISAANPVVILIEGLPEYHTQTVHGLAGQRVIGQQIDLKLKDMTRVG